MFKKKCLIIEDSEIAIVTLSMQLEKLSMYDISVARNYNQAKSCLSNDTYDLIFLDIKLHESSGLDLVSEFPKLPPVIVTSSNVEFAIDTYEINSVMDFIKKPVTEDRLIKAIDKALNRQQTSNSIVENNFVFIKTGRHVMKFDFEKLDYINAYGIYSKIYSDNKSTIVNESIATLEEALPNQIFRRVHKSYIINIKKVTGYDHKNIFINEVVIPIGFSYKKNVSEFIQFI
ncbi:LytR/AlgR family response regulator transcription factor [Flectobacillus roseus]|uniref:LytR/AlgR family response regulator transcription factor n=1 Tax=Flectobacillus roseus TaxID=502259 RepID=UPI0024B863CC|nr:LytTR family DNA-binding domain-containing protein [Flectobacillus roseus]MDI9872254.1 LytTR family DNA-binding domain-containing protein [Flectobacillus roseus]